ncbi:helix-turn-helix transcriptional regulator [Sphingobium sp. AS12]|uniref:helix-turn-helix transcriptional regulator n=1 Tax=Sphingobium sp. AS12 TaxID=2849495 RepID=UPI001C31CF97|nr:helix-turn-helix transcriptional regulator [Sphingobium sp. AS12]MBV2148110.1 helix-turn-helix transcriptional regulator [Sphingobium sp. AS12]
MIRFESARFDGDGYAIELKSREWAGPVITRLHQDSHLLYLSLPPIVYRGDVRFPDIPDARKIRLGRSVYYPAGHAMECWGTGGTAYSIGCTIKRWRFEQILGFVPSWGAAQLERGCNLDRSPVLAVLAHLAQEMRLPAIGHAALVESLTTRAIVELARYLGNRPGDEEETGKLSAQQLQRINDRLQAEELGPPTVAELAQICSVSERHLLRLFHATTGTTVSAHIRAALIDRARAMLEVGKPIKQIAHALGFSGPSSFSLAFRKITGISPAIWRADRQNVRMLPDAKD